MSEPPSSNSGGGGGRLHRCIRDLAALNALPSMCIGCSPDEALDIVLDALPTALSCDLVFVALPGSPPKERATLAGTPASGAKVAEIKAAISVDALGTGIFTLPGVGRFWYFAAELPVGAGRGRLVAARKSPLDPETDRMLVRNAANL